MKWSLGRKKVLPRAMGILASAIGILWAGGMSVPNGEIRINNLLTGCVYIGSRDVLRGQPYIVNNNTDGPLDFSIEAVVPRPDQMVKDYEPVPDASWVTFSKSYLSSEGGKTGETDFYISIPPDPVYRGKKFQIQMLTRTVGVGFMQMGLSGRTLMTISEADVPMSAAEKKTHNFAVRLNFDPPFIVKKNVSSGQKMSLGDVFEKEFAVRNDSEIPARCRIQHVFLKESFVQPPPGYQPCPDLKWLKINSSKVSVPAHGTVQVKGSLLIPAGKDTLGKKFYFVVKMTSLDNRAPVEKYARIFVETQK